MYTNKDKAKVENKVLKNLSLMKKKAVKFHQMVLNYYQFLLELNSYGTESASKKN